MTDRKTDARRVSLVLAVSFALGFLPIGCGQGDGIKPPVAASAPATGQAEKSAQPATAAAAQTMPSAQISPTDSPGKTTATETPATAPVPASLPARALLALDELSPAVEKPVNKIYEKKLPEQAVKSLAEAQKLLADKNIPGAINELERAVGFDPQNPDVHRSLGLAYAALPDFGKAEDNLQVAVKTMPDDFESQMILGKIAALQRQPAKAILALRTAMKCTDCKVENPKAASALWSLAQLLDKEGSWTASLECMEKLAGWIDSNSQLYSSEPPISDLAVNPEKLQAARGNLLFRLRKFDRAAALLEKAWKRDRANLQTLQMLLESLASSGQYQQAEQIIVQVASDKAAAEMAGGLAESLCLNSRDRSMPLRIWKAYRAKTQPKPSFGAALARAAQRLGARDDAVGIAKFLIADAPNDPQAISILAKIYLSSDQQDEAFRTLGRAIAANPYNQALAETLSDMLESNLSAGLETRLEAIADADQSDVKHAIHYLAGLVAGNRGNTALAIDQFTKAIQAKNDFYPPYQAKFDLLLVLKKKKGASDLLNQLEKTSPKGAILPYLKAKQAIADGNVEDALELLDEARQADPKHPQTLLLLAQTMLMQGRTPEAVETLEAAIKANGGNVELCRQLFDLYMAQRRPNDAQVVAATLMESSPLQAKLMLADLYIQTQQKAKAISLLEQIQQQHGQNVQAKLLAVQLGVSDFKGVLPMPEYERTVALLDQVVRQHPGSLPAKKMLGTLLYQHWDYARSAKVWREIYEQSTKLPETVRVLAAILIKAGDYKPACDLLKEAAETYPDDFEIKLQYVGALKKAKQYAEIDKLIDRWVQAMERDAAMDFLLAQKLLCLCLAKEFDKAVKLTDELLDSNPESLLVRQELLSSLVDGGKTDKAMELVEDGLKGDWHSPAGQAAFEPFLKRWKILLLCKTGKTDQAIEFAKAWCEEDAENVQPRASLTAALMEADKIDQAIKILDDWLKALNADGSKRVDDVTEVIEYCWEAVVRLCLASNKSADALARADKYIKYASVTSDLQSLKSMALMDLGKKREALAALEKAYGARKTDPLINNDLSYNYAEFNTNLDKAEQMIRFAVQQIRQSRNKVPVAVQDTLGWVLYKQGKFSEAGAAFNDALDSMEDESPSSHAVIYDHAGDVLYRLGWTEKAVSLWKQAIEAGAKEKRPQSDVKHVLAESPKKIKAIETRGQPALALTAKEAATRPATMPATRPTSRPATAPATQPKLPDLPPKPENTDDTGELQPDVQPAGNFRED
ncbi:MAG: tetratricopeptide repeat protein [Planctomycetes bacterium]|nr:tetratricopeptide repeat protein [Planctomycetota bacterium]